MYEDSARVMRAPAPGPAKQDAPWLGSRLLLALPLTVSLSLIHGYY